MEISCSDLGIEDCNTCTDQTSVRHCKHIIFWNEITKYCVTNNLLLPEYKKSKCTFIMQTDRLKAFKCYMYHFFN